MYIEVPGLLNLEGYLYDLLHYLVHAHIHNFNLSSLDSTLSMSGFSLLKGDESCRGVFKRNYESISYSNMVKADNAENIYHYLIKAEDMRKHNSVLIKKLWKMIWQTLFRIGNIAVKTETNDRRSTNAE